MLDEVLAKLSARLGQVRSSLAAEFSGIRSNRANPAMVDSVEVEVYGSKMKLRDVAHISAPDPRMIVIQPWDGSQVEIIAKGLSSAGLGINPSVDGGVIRLPLPPLTQERRAELVKIIRGKLEEARVSTRQARQDALQALESEGANEDEVTRGKGQIQRQVDEVSSALEEMAKAKETEVMTL